MKEYRIHRELSLEESLRSVLVACIAYVKDQVKNNRDVHETIHESRRTLKRIRALLRMIRDEIGNRNYQMENDFYRELSARLSPARDSFVLLKILGELSPEMPEDLTENAIVKIRRSLELATRKELERFSTISGGFDHFLEDLEAAGSRIEKYCQLRDTFASIRKGIRRTYRKVRRQLGIIRKHHSPEQFHEYRKCNKYLLYQMELIAPLQPKIIGAFSDAVDRHDDLLGLSRDYARLERYIRQGMGLGHFDPACGSLAEAIASKREKMMQEIRTEGARIYKERPGDFVSRLESCWTEPDSNDSGG